MVVVYIYNVYSVKSLLLYYSYNAMRIFVFIKFSGCCHLLITKINVLTYGYVMFSMLILLHAKLFCENFHVMVTITENKTCLSCVIHCGIITSSGV